MKASDREDIALMQELASGDSSALDKLYRKHRGGIEAFVRRKLLELPLMEAADIVQEVFKRVQQKAALYKPTGKVISWIRKIAQNIITDLARQSLSRTRRETSYAIVCPPHGGEIEGEMSNGAAPVEAAQGDFVVLEREAGGQYTVWLGDLPERRIKRGRNDKLRKWMQGGGADNVLGMFRPLGVVHEES